MEDTHMIEPVKIEKLLFILTIAFCWAYKTGELSARRKPIVVKKHGRLSKSVFRVGLDLIRSTLLRWVDRMDPYLSLLRYFPSLKSGGHSI